MENTQRRIPARCGEKVGQGQNCPAQGCLRRRRAPATGAGGRDVSLVLREVSTWLRDQGLTLDVHAAQAFRSLYVEGTRRGMTQSHPALSSLTR